ncbi:MAG: hypothetical protein WAN60_15695 [Candidatus Sulfotelmatobacter sp.]
MAQYEQKTDSREFELANPERNSASWGGDPGTDATDIAIRLWGPERSGRSARLTWKADSVLVYMIADLVGASRGRVGEESSAVMAAHFDGSRQALVAARRIQTSILEFVACRPGERIGAAILIYPSSANSPAGVSGEMARQALADAKPGQILLAEYSSQQLRDLPGIEIRPVPALTIVPGDWQSGLTELIWTTADRLAQLQDSIGAEVEPQSGENRPVDATVIVTSSVRDAREGPTNEAAPTPVSDSFQQSSGSSLTEELDESRDRPLLARTRVILGVAAVVLVVVLIFVFQRPARVSTPPLIPPQEQTGVAENPIKQPLAPPEPEAKAAQPEPTASKPPAKVPVAVAHPRTPTKPPLDNRAKNNKENKENAEAPESYDDSGGVSLKDIPALLGMAQRDAGAGNYDKAKREYKKILSLQPGNQEAKDGLRRLDLIQQDHQ